MPGYLLTMSVVVTCAHGGMAKPTVPNPRVKLSGTPVPMVSSPFMVAGCAYQTPAIPPFPSPCIMAMYISVTGTTRVKSMGQPLLCQTSMTSPATVTPPAPPLPLLPVSFAGQVRVQGM